MNTHPHSINHRIFEALWCFGIVFCIANAVLFLYPLTKDTIQFFEPAYLLLWFAFFILIWLRSVFPLIYVRNEWKIDVDTRMHKQKNLIVIGWLFFLLIILLVIIVMPTLIEMFLFEFVSVGMVQIALTTIHVAKRNSNPNTRLRNASLIIFILFNQLAVIITFQFPDLRTVIPNYFTGLLPFNTLVGNIDLFTVISNYFTGLLPLNTLVGNIDLFDELIRFSLRMGDYVLFLPFLYMAMMQDDSKSNISEISIESKPEVELNRL
jgi:hypothetical protein